MERNPRVKLDDVGDALLHSLNDILCGGSSYRQLVPSNVALHCNRTVKQLKGYEGFTREHSGALTKCAVTAMKQICDEAAGSNSLLTEKKDKIVGASYIRTNLTTSQKFQVISSAGKLTNAILSCFNWMSENAKTFVEKRIFSVDRGTKLHFFRCIVCTIYIKCE